MPCTRWNSSHSCRYAALSRKHRQAAMTFDIGSVAANSRRARHPAASAQHLAQALAEKISPDTRALPMALERAEFVMGELELGLVPPEGLEAKRDLRSHPVVQVVETGLLIVLALEAAPLDKFVFLQGEDLHRDEKISVRENKRRVRPDSRADHAALGPPTADADLRRDGVVDGERRCVVNVAQLKIRLRFRGLLFHGASLFSD